MGKDADRHLPS